MKTQVSTLSTFRRPSDRQPAMTNGSPRRTASARMRIVIVDDHPITLAGLHLLLSGERDFTVVARCIDAHEAVRALRMYEPDVLVVDQDMPTVDGVEILKQLRTSGDHTPVVLLATANNHKLTQALTFNVEGIVFKQSDPKHLIRCLRE